PLLCKRDRGIRKINPKTIRRPSIEMESNSTKMESNYRKIESNSRKIESNSTPLVVIARTQDEAIQNTQKSCKSFNPVNPDSDKFFLDCFTFGSQ
ncbi:MAG: hypothetical protein PHX48_02665, partial [Bacteroidales bacterium]|nr:hypothetical protein [Bacteroidales bacterium]